MRFLPCYGARLSTSLDANVSQERWTVKSIAVAEEGGYRLLPIDTDYSMGDAREGYAGRGIGGRAASPTAVEIEGAGILIDELRVALLKHGLEILFEAVLEEGGSERATTESQVLTRR